ncbi:MAG TPA: signal recognition particle-docking protein FtsY [Acidimicrobiales bacterium]|nr:signal recognition particle-docking protein FtsY [Acidimicrobiales bacterium]
MTILVVIVILVVAAFLIAAPLTYTRARARRLGRGERPPSVPPATGGRRPPGRQGPGRQGGPGGPGGTGAPSAPPRPDLRRPPSRPPAPPRPVTAPPPPPVGAPPAPPAEAPEAPEAPPAPPGAAPPAEAPAVPTAAPPAPPAEAAPVEAPPAKPRFRDRLGKARALFSSFLSRTSIDDETWDDLEEALIRADVGVKLTTALLDDLRSRVRSEGITSAPELVEALKEGLKKSLAAADRGLHFEPGVVNVWLFVGVNGVGKTTTIGKIGRQQAAAGRKVVMAAADTFRAAAAEQLELWSERVGADLVRGAEGGDPGAVIFDAVQRAASRGADLVLGDTAGRLHTKVNLMEELKKVRRVAERPPGHLDEVLLVIDATTGQNGLAQARQFADAVGVTGVVLTKLDGTAKGGIAIAIQTELGIPIKLVGLGESADDLTEFDPDEFVDALLAA